VVRSSKSQHRSLKSDHRMSRSVKIASKPHFEVKRALGWLNLSGMKCGKREEGDLIELRASERGKTRRER